MKLTLDCEIEITKFDDLVLIEYCGEDWPQNHIDHILLRNADYKKSKKPSQLLPEKIPIELRVYRYSARYIKSYLEGDWSPDYDNWTLDPRRYLKRGDLTNLYIGDAFYDGYIRQLDGKILTCKVNCEFWASYYHISALLEVLQKHPRFSNITVDLDIHALYQPKPGELDKYEARPNRKYGLTDVGGSYGVIHDMPVIKKFSKPQDYD